MGTIIIIMYRGNFERKEKSEEKGCPREDGIENGGRRNMEAVIIHPPPAVNVTASRAAESSAPTVKSNTCYYPPDLGGSRRVGIGRFVNRPYGHNRHGFSM